MHRFPLLLAACLAACAGERVPVQISLGVSPDQVADFALVTTVVVTLSGPDRPQETLCVPLGPASPFASIGGLAVRSRFDLRVEGLDAGGASIFFGERLGIVPPVSFVLPLRRRNDFARTLGLMRGARRKVAAVRLGDGRVLITGGENPQTGQALSSAELFDPMSATFADTGPMNRPRAEHAAVVIRGGRVLVAGGVGTGYPLEIEVYDPATGRFEEAGTISTERAGLSATAYTSSGQERVLLAGGRGPAGPRATADVYDVANRVITQVKSLGADRSGHGVAVLSDRAILVGGNASEARGEIFFFTDERLGFTAGAMAAPRASATAVVTDAGRILVGGPGDRIEAVDENGQFTPVTTLSTTIAEPRLAALRNGRALIVGGGAAFVLSGDTAEPPEHPPDRARQGHSAVALADGTILVVGGVQDASADREAEVFLPDPPP